MSVGGLGILGGPILLEPFQRSWGPVCMKGKSKTLRRFKKDRGGGVGGVGPLGGGSGERGTDRFRGTRPTSEAGRRGRDSEVSALCEDNECWRRSRWRLVRVWGQGRVLAANASECVSHRRIDGT